MNTRVGAWTDSRALAAFARAVIAKHTPREVEYFILRLEAVETRARDAAPVIHLASRMQ